MTSESIIGPDDRILITGATGFIGSKVVAHLIERGFRSLRCVVRPSSSVAKIDALARAHAGSVQIEVLKGNLLSRQDCAALTNDVAAIIHLAAARGEKSFPDAFMNSVVTTRNLLEAVAGKPGFRRFVNISSFAVYTNQSKARRNVLDETCPTEARPHLRGDAYCFAKLRQDDIVVEYSEKFGIPYVIVRPGYVYGPGNEAITSRVGIGTFGVFLHLGGGNPIPFTYVDNCVDAIVLAAMTKGVEGEVFNIVDDDLPSSRKFLRLYKKRVRRFPSIYLPKAVSYSLSRLWEAYSDWSQGQLPPAYNRRSWYANWKKTRYSNDKLKTRLGWRPRISTAEGLERYFTSCRDKHHHA